MKMLIPLAASLAVAVAGCGGSDEAAPPIVEVRGDEYAYVLPQSIEGGAVTMRFTNTGEELHEYALGKLTRPDAVDDLREAIAKQDSGRFGELVDDVGGVPTLSPGEEVSITRELEPGTYVLLCFVPSPDGTPHVAKGMLRTFDVKGDSGAELPEADAAIVARNDSFEIPELPAGEQTLELRNDSSEPREFYLYSPEPGVTLKQVEAWGEGGFKGEPLAVLLGAMQSIPPGASVYLTVDLEAGRRYVFFDEKLSETEFSVG